MALPRATSRRLGRAAALVATLVSLWGCTEVEDSTAPEPPAPAVACKPGESAIEGGACRPAGVQANGCTAGEVGVEGGGCRPPGVPIDGCAAGFEHDEAAGCTATLPAEACEPGSMALMGDSACREVAPCGSTTWGDVATDATTQLVDGAYAGGGSDGTSAHPWTTVQEAIDAAEPGAVVAIAAGSYAEDLRIQAKAVRLWGRCPALVEIVGSNQEAAAIVVSGGDGVELRDLSVRGAANGVAVASSGGVVLDRVWLHDLGARGMTVRGPGAAVEMTRSLIEAVHEAGVLVEGSNATISASVIRDVEATAAGLHGEGVAADDEPQTAVRANVAVRGSLIERTHAAGLQFAGSDGTVEGCLIRDIQPHALDGDLGRGVRIREGFETAQRSNVAVSSTVVERCHEIGISVGTSDGALDKVVVRDILRGPLQPWGTTGVAIQNDADATVTSLVVERTSYVGVAVLGAHATFDAIVVRDTLSDVDTTSNEIVGGVGFAIQHAVDTGRIATGVLRSSSIERSQGAGVVLTSPDAAVEGCVVRDNEVFEDGIGLGIHMQPGEVERTHVAITSTIVERNRGAGVSFQGVDGTMEGTIVRDTRAIAEDGTFGAGVHVHYDPFDLVRSSVVIASSVVERNRVAGIDVHAADLILRDSVVRDTELDVQVADFGDGIVVRHGDELAPMEPASAQITSCLIESSARAGISAFGAAVVLGSTVLECNPIALDAEGSSGVDATFQDVGGNVCGCASTVEPCRVLRSNIQAPQPPDISF